MVWIHSSIARAIDRGGFWPTRAASEGNCLGLLVANPGCYSTSAILALAPIVKEGLIHPDIVVDSKSGVSGAGRTLSLTTIIPRPTRTSCLLP